jgi:hypothetical protein
MSLFMDSIGKCNLLYTTASIGLSSIQRLTCYGKILNLETYEDVLIRWWSWNLLCDTFMLFMKAVYDSQVNTCLCHKREQCAEQNKMLFWKGARGYEACISKISCQKSNSKSKSHILRMIIQNSNKEYRNHTRRQN